MDDRPPPLAPMLAGRVGMPADPAGWLFEPKWDGIRALVTLDRGTLRMSGRNGNEVTAAYPELTAMAEALADRRAVLDGEVVTFDTAGRPSFERLQRRIHVRRPPRSLLADVPVVFVAFDLLWLDGHLLVALPQRERRRALEALQLSGGCWQTSPLLPDAPGPDLLAACQAIGLEGYMAKRADAPYLPGQRSAAWSKVKAVGRREFVVGGWSPGAGRRAGSIGSLALGAYPEAGGGDAPSPARLRYVGQAGSGLSDDLLSRLCATFAASARPGTPFDGPVPRGISFVEPTLVVEVAFNGVTSAGLLRQPSIKGLRTDVAAANVTLGALLRNTSTS